MLRAVIAAVLLSTPGLAPSQTFTTGILQVDHYGRSAGVPLILVPALYCGACECDAQIEGLAPRHDQYVVTLPGFAGRPMVSDGDLMMLAVNSLQAIVTQRHLSGRVIVVGHSLGGTIAVLFAQRYPRDAREVISVEGGYPISPTASGREQRVAAAVRPFQHLPQEELGQTLCTAQLQYVITRSADVNAVEELASTSRPQAIVEWMRAALLLDLSPGMSKTVVPFTVIVPFDQTIDSYRGFTTEAAKRAAYDAWIAHVRNAHVIMIAPSRHFVMFDQSQVFEDTLQHLLPSKML